MSLEQFKKVLYLLILIIPWLFVLILGIKLYFSENEAQNLRNRVDSAETMIVEQKTLKDDLTRSQAQLIDQDNLIKIIDDQNIEYDQLQKDFDLFKSRITGVNVITTTTPGGAFNNLPSSSTLPSDHIPIPSQIPCENGSCPNPDKYNYLNIAQKLELKETFGKEYVEFGEVTFSAWRSTPWDIKIKSREYKTTTILSTDENGRHYIYNQFSLLVDGKEHKLPIQKANFVEQKPEAHFQVNPRLYLGLDAGALVPTKPNSVQPEVMPNLQISILSYGQDKNTPNWTFLNLGLGFEIKEQRPAVIFTPVTYNVGQHIPLMKNVQVGPSISLDTNVNVMAGVGLHVGF